jgi:hypothetical protein
MTLLFLASFFRALVEVVWPSVSPEPLENGPALRLLLQSCGKLVASLSCAMSCIATASNVFAVKRQALRAFAQIGHVWAEIHWGGFKLLKRLLYHPSPANLCASAVYVVFFVSLFYVHTYTCTSFLLCVSERERERECVCVCVCVCVTFFKKKISLVDLVYRSIFFADGVVADFSPCCYPRDLSCAHSLICFFQHFHLNSFFFFHYGFLSDLVASGLLLGRMDGQTRSYLRVAHALGIL